MVNSVRHARRSLSLPATGTGNVPEATAAPTPSPNSHKQQRQQLLHVPRSPARFPNDDAHHSAACPRPEGPLPAVGGSPHTMLLHNTMHPAWQHYSTAMARRQAGSATRQLQQAKPPHIHIRHHSLNCESQAHSYLSIMMLHHLPSNHPEAMQPAPPRAAATSMSACPAGYLLPPALPPASGQAAAPDPRLQARHVPT
jgi:hypothetical protein